MFSDDISVLSILRNGHHPQHIWAGLYPVAGAMVRRALRLGRNPRLDPDTEDLVCESVYQALRNVERYRSTFRGATESSARAWLKSVCRNASMRQAVRRRRKSKRSLAADPATLETLMDRTRACPAGDYEGLDLASLERIIPNPAWRSIWLLYNRPGKALDHEEIARLTGRTVGSVKVLLSRARSAIRRELGI